MSLILSRASRDYVLQVSSRPAKGGVSQNILYGARNGITALGYAGLDAIGGVPTGQWLAASLASAGARDLGRGLRSLAEALSAVGRRPEGMGQWMARDFDVHVAGWQWSGNRSRPVVAGLSKAPGSAAVRIEYLPRYWHWDRGPARAGGRRGYRFNVTAAPDTQISRAQLQSVVNRLRDLAPDEAERVLVETIREIGASVAEVGPNALSILLHPRGKGRGRVRYLAAPFVASPRVAGAPQSTQNGRAKVLATLSPWLVGPEGLGTPFVLGERKEIQFGGYVVEMEGPTG